MEIEWRAQSELAAFLGDGGAVVAISPGWGPLIWLRQVGTSSGTWPAKVDKDKVWILRMLLRLSKLLHHHMVQTCWMNQVPPWRAKSSHLFSLNALFVNDLWIQTLFHHPLPLSHSYQALISFTLASLTFSVQFVASPCSPAEHCVSCSCFLRWGLICLLLNMSTQTKGE